MHIAAPEQRGESCLQNNLHEDTAHLFANVLLAVCTLIGALDDWVFRDDTPCLCEKEQNNTKGDKVNDMIDKGTAGDKM